MRRRPEESPRWKHSDGRPYDELDLGFARYLDEADLEARATVGGSLAGRMWASLARLLRPRAGKS